MPVISYPTCRAVLRAPARPRDKQEGLWSQCWQQEKEKGLRARMVGQREKLVPERGLSIHQIFIKGLICKEAEKRVAACQDSAEWPFPFSLWSTSLTVLALGI